MKQAPPFLKAAGMPGEKKAFKQTIHA